MSQVAALLFLPLLFRLYTPDDFGLWAALQAGVAATAALALLRYDLAVVVEPDDNRASTIFWVCVTASVVVAAFVATVAAAALTRSDPVTWGYSAVALSTVWLLSTVLNQPLQAWLLRGGRFGSASVSVVTTTIVTNLVQVAAVARWPDFRGLIAGSAVGALFGLVVSWAICLRNRPAAFRVPSEPIAGILRPHGRFVRYSVPYTIFSLLRERAPVLLAAALMPPALVGVYSQAWRLVNLPAGLVGSALRPVIFHAAAREGVDSVGGMIQQMIRGMMFLGAPWLGFLIVDPGYLLAQLLGDPWEPSGPYLALLAAPALLFTATNWLDRLLDVVRRQDANLKLETFIAFVSVGGFGSAFYVGATLFQATVVQAVALSLGYLVILMVVYRICRFPRSPLIKILMVAAVQCGVVWLVGRGGIFAAGTLEGLAAAAVVATVMSAAVCWWLGRPLLAKIAGAR